MRITIAIRAVLVAAATPAFYYGYGALGLHISWLIAFILAALLVLGGWLVIAIAVDT